MELHARTEEMVELCGKLRAWGGMHHPCYQVTEIGLAHFTPLGFMNCFVRKSPTKEGHSSDAAPDSPGSFCLSNSPRRWFVIGTRGPCWFPVPDISCSDLLRKSLFITDSKTARLQKSVQKTPPALK